MTTDRTPFAFDPAYRAAGLAFGVTPATAYVELDDDRFIARFGRWTVDTPRRNIRGAGVTGPYGLARTIGPAHLSFADRGLTFATNAQQGVCLTFREPVTGIDPFGLIKHPGLTVTVTDPGSLVDQLTSGPVRRTDLDTIEAEQAALDRLRTMTASDLRSLADDLDVPHAASMSQRELVDLIEPAAGDDLVALLASRA